MTKKLWLLLALAVVLLFAGCDYLDINVEDLNGTPTHQVGAEGQETSPAPSESPAAEGGNTTQDEAPVLSDADFTITVDDLTISAGMDPAPVLDALGDGGADEDNNFGFVGWDEANQYKYYQHIYDGFTVFVKTDPEQGTSVVSQIDLTGMSTRRGVKAGDAYDDIVAQYGVPDSEETANGISSYIYESGDKSLTFRMGEEDTIDTIYIQ